MNIYYLRTITEKVRETLLLLQAEEHGGLKLEKLHGLNRAIYSVRVNGKERLLLTPYKDGMLFLVHMTNHKYEGNKYLQPGVLIHYLQRLSREEFSGLEALSSDAEAMLNFEACNEALNFSEEGAFVPLESYQQHLIQFNDEQKRALALRLPGVIYGPAGSGKSCVALSSLSETARKNPKGRFLYLSLSEKLVDDMHDFFAATYSEDIVSRVDFKTYKDLIAEDIGSKELLLDGKDEFYAWYQDYQRTMNKVAAGGAGGSSAFFGKGTSIFHNPKAVWQECRIRSGYEEVDAYLALGRKESVLDEIERRAIDTIYTAYQEYLAPLGRLSEALYCFKAYPLSYDLIVVDESQDLSRRQLKELARLSFEYKILYCFCGLQILQDKKSQYPYLQQLFYKTVELDVACLPSVYRSGQEILNVANQLLAIKHAVIGGKGDTLETSYLESASKKRAMVQWSACNNRSLFNEIQIESESRPIAIVTWPAYVAEAKKLFGKSSVFTPEQIKGLEYSKVVLYRLLDCPDAKEVNKAIPKDLGIAEARAVHRPKGESEYEAESPFLHALFTAVTRAMNHLVMIQDEAHGIKAFCTHWRSAFSRTVEMKEDVGFATAPLAEVVDWEAELKKLLRPETMQQARDLAKDHLNLSTEAEFLAWHHKQRGGVERKDAVVLVTKAPEELLPPKMTQLERLKKKYSSPKKLTPNRRANRNKELLMLLFEEPSILSDSYVDTWFSEYLALKLDFLMHLKKIGIEESRLFLMDDRCIEKLKDYVRKNASKILAWVLEEDGGTRLLSWLIEKIPFFAVELLKCTSNSGVLDDLLYVCMNDSLVLLSLFQHIPNILHLLPPNVWTINVCLELGRERTLFFHLLRDSEGQKIFTQIIEACPRLLDVMPGDVWLIYQLESNIQMTVFGLLFCEDSFTEFFKKLIKEHPEFIKKIPPEAWNDPCIASTSCGSESMGTMAVMAYPKNLPIVQELLFGKAFEGFVRSQPPLLWETIHNIRTNETFFDALSWSPEGLNILEKFIKNYPDVIQKLDPFLWEGISRTDKLSLVHRLTKSDAGIRVLYALQRDVSHIFLTMALSDVWCRLGADGKMPLEHLCSASLGIPFLWDMMDKKSTQRIVCGINYISWKKVIPDLFFEYKKGSSFLDSLCSYLENSILKKLLESEKEKIRQSGLPVSMKFIKIKQERDKSLSQFLLDTPVMINSSYVQAWLEEYMDEDSFPVFLEDLEGCMLALEDTHIDKEHYQKIKDFCTQKITLASAETEGAASLRA